MFDDPFILVVLGAVLLFFFFLYLFVRRTLTGFREGIEKGGR